MTANEKTAGLGLARLLQASALALVCLAAVLAWRFWLGPAKPAPSPSPVAAAGYENLIAGKEAYAGSASCRDCHKEAFDLWQPSHHARAERPVDLVQDRSAFDPPHTFKHGTQVSDTRVTPGGRIEIVTMSRQGDRQVFGPERVIGVKPLQQFLVSAPGGRHQVTEVAYDPRSNQWFNIYGEEDRQAGEWGHWTGRGMNWNMMCAFCHNTGVDKGYRRTTDSYATTMIEAGVGCESCHGPMADHVKWQRPRSQPAKGDPTLRRFSKDQMRDTCAICHARRAELTGTFRVGDGFFDHYGLSIVDETDVYYPDGQVRDEDYEFAPFLGSRMHYSGVRCLDCHQPHSAKIRLPSDDLCMTCHGGPIAPAPKIDAATHSFHKRGTPGDHCVDCHMPQTVYMARHWRRDHGFTVPDPLLTREHGIPNACNRCHKDKTVDWSIEAVNKWYTNRMDRPARERTRVIARARAGAFDAAGALAGLSRREPIPYWRAAATLLLRRSGEDAQALSAILDRAGDTNELVRAMSARAMEPWLGQPRVEETLARLLSDPVRLVRVESAWALRRTLDTNTPAGRDLRRFLDWSLDQPQGLLQNAVWQMDRGNNPAALSLLQKAVEWDRYSAPLFNALAVSLSLERRHDEALKAMETACQLAPRDAEFRFRLALALNELNRQNEAVAALEATVKLDPSFGRAWYNLGLAHSEQGRPERALEALARAEALEPRSPQPPYARATVLARQGRHIEARAAALKALQVEPRHSEAARLLEQLPPSR